MASSEELDFVSKLLDTQKEIAKKTNSSYKWNFGLTALLFGILFGLVHLKDEIAIESINLTTSPVLVMILLSVALLLSQINGVALKFESSNLVKRIREIYKPINADSELLNDEDIDRILYPDIIETIINENLFLNNILGKIYFVLSHLIVGLGLRTAPIVAQVYAMSYLFQKYPFNGWLIAMCALYSFVQVTVMVSIVKQFSDDFSEDHSKEKEAEKQEQSV